MPTFHCSNVEEVMAQPEMSRLLPEQSSITINKYLSI